ncbi:hypothetical protein [Arenimonas oryziterrae]|nr:hypothetical protein [Arenimonas oryziterrae]
MTRYIPAILLFVFLLAGVPLARPAPNGPASKGESAPNAGSNIPTHATELVLHKCIAPDGTVSFQDRPCATQSRTAWSRAVLPEHVTPDTRRPTGERRQRDPGARIIGRMAGSDGSTGLTRSSRPAGDRDPRLARCAHAKEQRDTTLARIGLKRTFDLLRALDREVEIACQCL